MFPMMSGFPGLGLAFIWPFVILDLILKGFALWRSAKNNHPFWFIAILIINSAGILPLIYLIAIDKQTLRETFSKASPSKLKK